MHVYQPKCSSAFIKMHVHVYLCSCVYTHLCACAGGYSWVHVSVPKYANAFVWTRMAISMHISPWPCI